MSEEAFNELIENIEVVSQLTMYGRKNIKYYVNKLQKENLQLKDTINKAKKYIKNNSHKTEWGDLEQDNESIDINDDVTDTEFITDLIEILDNKGE